MSTEHDDGIYENMPEAEYRAIKRMSKSTLAYGRVSMAHLKAKIDGVIESDETPALAFGRALHMRVLEPTKFADAYAVMPKFDMRTKDGKAAAAAWQEANPGAEPVTQDDADKIAAMVQSIRDHAKARAHVQARGGCEVAVLWTDEATGVKMKARVDKYIAEAKPRPVVVDLKTCADITTHELSRAVSKYGYDMQDAVYTAGIKAITGTAPDFLFLFVEKSAPYTCRLVRLDDDAKEAGRLKYRAILTQYAKCLESGSFPAWGSNIETIELPAWEAKALEQMRQPQ